MRYTLRLLTLDQLGRAAALMCALELEREKAPETLGEWPLEIALWVGRAATPNYMGRKGDSSSSTARAKTLRFARDTSSEPPVPLEQCPWCGTPFNKYSFQLYPDSNEPKKPDHMVRRTGAATSTANGICRLLQSMNRFTPACLRS